MDGEWKRGWSKKEELERHKRFFFSPVWFSIRGTRGDKTKRTVTQRNNPSSVPSCSCSSSSSSSLSLTLSLSVSLSLSLSPISTDSCWDRVAVHRDSLLTSSATYWVTCTLTVPPHDTSVTGHTHTDTEAWSFPTCALLNDQLINHLQHW